ncbi:hypothetical protein [Paraburkholderia sp.]|uniref:hypothetical protein n=1 Tax=Paraburkholderia sp. TaxID=1926495 RepID=UPI002D408393|nr:hypothetical protein [Paraburkholderia sp.]HZZ04608.1 hypothetical protein [Paraburkholderia sp.]
MKNSSLNPAAREARDAERCNVFLCALSAMGVIGLFGGLLFAKSWLDLVLITGAAAWTVLGILLLAFIAGLCGGRNRG